MIASCRVRSSEPASLDCRLRMLDSKPTFTWRRRAFSRRRRFISAGLTAVLKWAQASQQAAMPSSSNEVTPKAI
jgi:hypothetical protein